MEARKIIITGGATRIGAAIAKKLSGTNKEIMDVGVGGFSSNTTGTYRAVLATIKRSIGSTIKIRNGISMVAI